MMLMIAIKCSGYFNVSSLVGAMERWWEYPWSCSGVYQLLRGVLRGVGSAGQLLALRL